MLEQEASAPGEDTYAIRDTDVLQDFQPTISANVDKSRRKHPPRRVATMYPDGRIITASEWFLSSRVSLEK